MSPSVQFSKLCITKGIKMIEQMSLGSCHPDEEPVQVSKDRPYIQEMKKQCHKWKEKMLEALGSDYLVKIMVRRNPHDFGDYYDVMVEFDSLDERELRIVLFLEGWMHLIKDDHTEFRKQLKEYVG